MKSNSIAGLAFALYPDDSYDQTTVVAVKNTADEKIIAGNNFFIELIRKCRKDDG